MPDRPRPTLSALQPRQEVPGGRGSGCGPIPRTTRPHRGRRVSPAARTTPRASLVRATWSSARTSSDVERPSRSRTTARFLDVASSILGSTYVPNRIRSSWSPASAHHAATWNIASFGDQPSGVTRRLLEPIGGICANARCSSVHAASSSAGEPVGLSVHPRLPRPRAGDVRDELEHAIADRDLVARAARPAPPGDARSLP